MKKLILFLLVLLAANFTVQAQAPQGFNFQGIALDGNGYVVASKLVSLRFSITTDSLGSAISYQESVSAQTDKYGQFTTVIGSGNPSIGDFKSIPWATGNLFMKTEIDIEGTGTYITVGLSKLLSVPYALQANSASNISSDSLHNTRVGSNSLFKNTTGNRNVANGTNSLWSNTTGTNNTGIGDSSLYSNTTGINNIAIGERTLFSNTSGAQNIAIGQRSLFSNTSGAQNIAIGPMALFTNNTGINNIAIGNQSMGANTTGSANIAIGYLSLAGNTTGSKNAANGWCSLLYNTTGEGNTANGFRSLYRNTIGNFNTAIGRESLYSNTSGSYNTAIGDSSLYFNTTGKNNSATGQRSLYSNTTGSQNSAIGNNAGLKLVTGDKNIFIGNDAGNNSNFTTTSNKLVIQNDSSKTPLIYGEFDTKKLTINGKLMVGDSSATTPSAVFEASSTTQGLLPPRMTTTQRDAISSPASGLVIFNTTTNGLEFKTITGWVSLTSSSAAAVFLPTIVIGKQQWMRENLDVVSYRNGDIIPQVTDRAEWAALTTGAWCYINNDPVSGAIYGKLYNWYAVNDPRGLAPQGWHVPTDAEWITLGTFLGGDALAGGKMKESGTLNWQTLNEGATNESGFSGLPGGSRDFDSGFFPNLGHDGSWWSSSILPNSSNPIIRTLFYDASYLDSYWGRRGNGYSVRCLRD